MPKETLTSTQRELNRLYPICDRLYLASNAANGAELEAIQLEMKTARLEVNRLEALQVDIIVEGGKEERKQWAKADDAWARCEKLLEPT